MSFCTQCGAIMQEADAHSHVCDSEDIPQLGLAIKRDGSIAAVKKVLV